MLKTRLRLIQSMLGLLIVVAGSVLAAPSAWAAGWQSVTETSKFHCEGDYWYPPGVIVKVCIVINSTSTQAVTIIESGSPNSLQIRALSLRLWHNGAIIYDLDCSQTTLYYNQKRACFGPTKNYPCGHAVQAYAAPFVGGTPYPYLTKTFHMCDS
jgi:hypothetical protein